MTRIAVIASRDHAAWIRAATGGLATTDDVAAAEVIVASAARAAEAFALARSIPVVLVGDPSGSIDPRAAHVVRPTIPHDQLQTLLRALSGARDATGPGEPARRTALARTAEEARAVQRAFSFSRKLAAAGDLETAETMTIDAVLELTRPDRARCVFLDPTGARWREAERGGVRRDGRALSGLAGYAAVTGERVVAERSGTDPRWAPSIDDPSGDGTERLVAQPVVSPTGFVHAVLVSVRVGRRLPFSAGELACLQRFAELLSPFFDQLSAHSAEQALIGGDKVGRLFRSEAVAAHAAPQSGHVIRLAPGWVSWAYWVLAFVLIGAGLFVTIGTVTTYSSGPALIRATSKRDLASRTSGNVAALSVRPGDVVAGGAVIAQLDDQSQRAALERAELEFSAQLRNHMLDPNDQASDQAVRQLRQVRDAARTALEERVVRSAVPGVVTDVRVRVGQHIEPGETIASMVDGDGPLEVIALLPGSDRPQLVPGMAVRLEIAGYRYAYQTLYIDSVSSDVIGPSAARRVLGSEVSESLAVTGAVVLVRGRLPQRTFTVDDVTYRFHDGMQGTAAVGVRSERILFALAPGLRRL
jgi:multidrug resistance efflux pump